VVPQGQAKSPGSTIPTIPSRSAAPGSLPSGPAKKFNEEDLEKASWIPLLMGVLGLLLAIVIWILNRHSSLLMSFVGYILCPLLIIFSLGLDSYLQRRKTSQGQWFIPNYNYGQVLRVLSAVGIIFAYPHISGLADHISAWLAQVFPWMAS
jgi:uncharacterized membrane protein